jgi:tetratricopeptide (TPR) repeat protein
VARGLPLLLLMMLSVTCSAQVYQWVDEEGQVHFSDRVPSGQAADKAAAAAQASARRSAPVAAVVVDNGPVLPGVSWDEIAHLRHLVRARQFEMLNKELADYRRKADADPVNEVLLWSAYQSFDLGVASMEDYFNDWVRLQAGVESSYLARASYQSGMAWRLLQESGRSPSEEVRKRIRNHFYAALTDLDAELRLNPQSSIAYALLIRMAASLGEKEQLRNYLEQASKDVPASFLVARMRLQFLTPGWGGSESRMMEYTRQVTARSAQNPLLAFLPGYVSLYLGNERLQRKDMKGALALYNQAIASGNNYEFYQARADLLLQMNRYTDAIKDYEQAARYNTGDAMLYLGEAKAFGGLGQYRNAAAELMRARKVDPSSLPAGEYSLQVTRSLVREGRDARKAGKLEESGDFLETALELNPKDADALYENALRLIDMQRFTEAQSQLETALDSRREDIRHYQLMETLLARRYQWDEVVSAWSLYIERHPEEAAGYEARAQANFNQKSFNAALSDAEKAVSLGSKGARSLVNKYKGYAEPAENAE